MKKVIFGTLVVLAVVIVSVLMRPRPAKPVAAPEPQQPVITVGSSPTNSLRTNKPGFFPLNRIKTPYSDFTDAEKAEFQSNFVVRYKPVFDKWANAFSGRLPFSPDALTVDKFVERIGPTDRYHEYVFVVDGITAGIEDKAGGAVRVDYVNAPTQTKELATIRTGQVPISTSPVTRDEIIQMLYADSGVQYKPNDIRVTPTGFSGSLNGGAYIGVGGNPDNEASWDYDIVLGSDGKIAFYLRPKPQ